MSEVANGTGYDRGRTTFTDAIALNAYRSGRYGGEVHGFEIKVSRADWRHELRDPGKAAAVQGWCDRWWLAVPEPASLIVHDGELPATWGLIGVTATGEARTLTAALPLTANTPALPRPFIAALVRRAWEQRAEVEARKGALLNAPLRQVSHGKTWGADSGIVLSCGHVHYVPAHVRMTKTARCLACADKLPPEAALVREAMRLMSADDLRALAAEAEAQAKFVDESPWLAGVRGGIGYAAMAKALHDAVDRNASDEELDAIAALAAKP